MKKTAPYGTWISPISADRMASKSVNFAFPRLFSGDLYWMESRPQEQGRTVIMRFSNKRTECLTKEGFDVRSKAQEYGGCCYTVGGGYLFFVNAKDQCIYKQSLTDIADIASISASSGSQAELDARYADLIYDPSRQQIIAVEESHSTDNSTEAVTRLVSFDVKDDREDRRKVVSTGSDFYAHPRLSPEGSQLLWLEWQHPNMPWNCTELWLADLDKNGTVTNKRKLSNEGEAIFQPEWSVAGEIFYVSDRDNWWNLYSHSLDTPEPIALLPQQRECGLPLWQYGMSTWGFLSDQEVLIAHCQGADWQFTQLNIATGQQLVPSGFDNYNHINGVTTDLATGRAAFLASGPKIEPELCLLENLNITCIAQSNGVPLASGDISTPHPVCFPTSNKDKCFAYFYPPANQSFQANDQEKPPLIVLCHGGPTASTSAAFNIKVQFWTTRGFAVIDVNYRGSTGYGRAYRDKLDAHWGIYDIDDACAAAEYAVDQGWADEERLIIRGSSAGGYTVLSALCFKDIFSAGCSLYGIGDLNTLVSDTHKFESRYPESLVAPLDRRDIYNARSPLYHIDGFDCPVIFLQGMQDKVVPPNQAESMVQALDKKQIPVAYVTFENEGHGFSDAKNLVYAFNAELAFYGRVFGFETDSEVVDLNIRNLEHTE